ncbi:DUF423 domain-containing protein [Tenacibaculum sp. E3R01]|uniref:DUF423 domain-containing protein n=1 Tax=unclassified Tenacibaculum TaxID=2635139 RepID=UPI0008976C41|nr:MULTISPECIES: DUF423 domain-containing protein [unclassified Tenacibaculum]RBW55231.1 DUF423 domain-containing protein [Tenacibaculum sp. E3R01]SEE21239.1 Uncharacterized membrane protein YgdD, TMEM256/DUF423 family [Tenacibaculum sp. MAR_2010_89]
MTQQTILFFGAIFGMLAVIFGAFGAHALKKILTDHQLKSFETGVKYQMYHAIVLLTIGFNFKIPNPLLGWSFIIGVLLFSFSIYGLVLSDAKGKKLRFLGPITPLGGLFLVIGWILLFVEIINL